MRFSFRKAVQVIFIFACIVIINLVLTLRSNGSGDSDAPLSPKFGQHKDGDGGNLLQGVPVARVERSLRRVSSVDKENNGEAGGKPKSENNNSNGLVYVRKEYRPKQPLPDSVTTQVAKTIKFSQGAPSPNWVTTQLSDIFISVKTTLKFHSRRMQLLLDTWLKLAKDQTYIFSDADDPELSSKTNNHVVNTNCASVHNRKALCCKMAVEFDAFLESKKRWFCHVDDDTYVNIPALLKTLQQYNHTEDWYLGKPSLSHPIELYDVEYPSQKIAFWFATGGAGFCISRSLALKMMPYASGGRLKSVGDKIRLPDDCTVGFIIFTLTRSCSRMLIVSTRGRRQDHYLKKELTTIEGFHSHLEGLWRIQSHEIQQHITFSYSQFGSTWNVVDIRGKYSPVDDPTRFKSIHCRLFPYIKECVNR